MNKPHDEKEPAFKVVDRRRFDEEGHEKASSEKVEQEKHESRASLESEINAPSKEPRHAMPINFSIFIQTLAHQAMMGLGVIAWPDTNLIRQDLVMAKETIDLLAMLKEKTSNNLDKDEHSLLEAVLYQLQMAYVEIANKNS